MSIEIYYDEQDAHSAGYAYRIADGDSGPLDDLDDLTRLLARHEGVQVVWHAEPADVAESLITDADLDAWADVADTHGDAEAAALYRNGDRYALAQAAVLQWAQLDGLRWDIR